MNDTELRDTLEKMIDDSHVGLQNVLSTLVQICTLKAHEARTTLNNHALTHDWTRTGAYISTAKAKVRRNTAIQ